MKKLLIRTDAGDYRPRQSTSVTRNKPNIRNIPSTQTYSRQPRNSYPSRNSSSANKDRKPAFPISRFNRATATLKANLASSFKKVGGRRIYNAEGPSLPGKRTQTNTGRKRY